MKEFLYGIKIRYQSIPMIKKQFIFGLLCLIVGSGIGHADKNIIYLIFAACIILCGFVLLFMGIINGIVLVFKPKKSLSNNKP